MNVYTLLIVYENPLHSSDIFSFTRIKEIIEKLEEYYIINHGIEAMTEEMVEEIKEKLEKDNYIFLSNEYAKYYLTESYLY